MEDQDRKIHQGLAKDDDIALDEILHSYGPTLDAYLAVRFVNQPEIDRDELIMATLFQVWWQRKKLDLEKPLLPWMIRVARNIGCTLLRSKVFRLSDCVSLNGELVAAREIDSPVFQVDLKDLIDNVLGGLSEDDRNLALAHIEDHSQGWLKRYADENGKSYQAVRKQASRLFSQKFKQATKQKP